MGYYDNAIGDIVQSNNGRTRLIQKTKQKIDNLELQYRFPQTISAPHTIVAKGLSEICPQDTTNILDSTDSNSR